MRMALGLGKDETEPVKKVAKNVAFMPSQKGESITRFYSKSTVNF